MLNSNKEWLFFHLQQCCKLNAVFYKRSVFWWDQPFSLRNWKQVLIDNSIETQKTAMSVRKVSNLELLVLCSRALITSRHGLYILTCVPWPLSLLWSVFFATKYLCLHIQQIKIELVCMFVCFWLVTFQNDRALRVAFNFVKILMLL